jgi:adenylate cyclase
MKWWARSLRTRIFVAFSAVVLGVLIGTLGLTQVVLSRHAQRTLNHELLETREVFHDLMRERAARLEALSTLLADEFGLKRAIATYFDSDTYEPGTLESVALNHRARIGVELFWIVDDRGELLAGTHGGSNEEPQPTRTTGGTAAETSLADLAPLQETRETDAAATAIAEVDGQLFQLVALPVFAPDVIGYLVLGQAIDDAFARRLRENTDSEISFLGTTRIFASSWPATAREKLAPALVATVDQQPFLYTMEGERYLTLVVTMSTPSLPLTAVIQESYDDALGPLRALQLRVAAIGLLALFVGLLVCVFLARGVTSPVRSLAAGMREVLRGNLRYRTRIQREDEVGFLAQSFNEMVGGLEDRERIKDTFGRFVSRDVADAVLGGRVPLAGERREVSILFQDIRGFTALSQELDPATLLRVLNQFFTEAVAAVETEGGVVKQFTGDGVMALFGAPQSYPDHARRAVRAALGIVERLASLNERLQEQGFAPLAIGAGIHSGEVVAGLIGPDERVEYGVVGEPVNLASRVEALTKEVKAVVLVTSDIADRLGPEFELGRTAVLPVKGSSQPLHVVEVLGVRPATRA